MKCFHHNDKEATATCQRCGKGLCFECTTRFSMLFCEDCILSYNKSVIAQMYKGIAVTLIIFVGFMIILGNAKISSIESLGFAKALIPAMMIAFTYWGWQFLSEKMRFLFFGNVIFWFFYFVIKLSLANIVGLFVGPYKIYTMFNEIHVANKTSAQIKRGEI